MSYFYSDVADPYPHQIRCLPRQDIDHDDGVRWLREIYATLDLLDIRQAEDYRRVSLTVLQFRTLEHATRFYNAMELELAKNSGLGEFL